MSVIQYEKVETNVWMRWRDFVALTKPRITLMVLFTSAIGMWLATRNHPSESGLSGTVIFVTLLATAGVVSAANTFNCWLERDIDQKMKRTADRPLPAGRLEASHAAHFAIALSAVSVPLLYLMVNPVTGLLGALALVSYAAVYTPLKGITPIALYVGAVPGAIPPLLGWTAVTGTIELSGFVLFAIMFVWQVPHFLAITLFRGPDYANAGLKVAPVVWGERAAKWQAALTTPILVAVSLLLYFLHVTGVVYLCIAIVAGLIFTASSIKLLLTREGEASLRWARRTFFASLIHLTAVFAALLIDAR